MQPSPSTGGLGGDGFRFRAYHAQTGSVTRDGLFGCVVQFA